MKKILSLGLASAMVLSMGASVLAKDENIAYPIGSISTNAYLYDSDVSAVDLASAVDSVPYGKTLYYPLLNPGAGASTEAIKAAQELVNTKQLALTAANTALEKANAAKELAAAVLAAATAWSLDSTNNDLQNAYNEALAAFDNTATPSGTAAEAVVSAGTLSTQADSDATDAAAAQATAQQELTDAQEALKTLADSSFRYVHESDAVSSLRIKQNWDMNGKLIGNVEIVKKKIVGENLAHKYIYFVAVSVKDGSSTTAQDVAGTIQLRKSGSFDYEDMQLDVNIEVAFPVATDSVITEDLQLFREGHGFAGDNEEEFRFDDDADSYFVVNTLGQSKLLLSANTRFDSAIADLYPNANLNFFSGNGVAFNKTGTLYLAAEPGSFLYRVGSNGTLVRMNAEYDEYDEAFVIRTKSLDRYVISDTELKIVDGGNNNNNNNGSNNGSTDVEVSNPSTGAAV